MKKKYSGPNLTTESEHQSPYPVSRLSGPISLVDIASEIEQADRFINTKTNAKLQVIAEQIKALQQEARIVLEQAEQDQDLHRVSCSFAKKPGTTYYLYEKGSGERYFSLLSPQDWQGVPPHRFCAAYRLEFDMSWQRLENE